MKICRGNRIRVGLAIGIFGAVLVPGAMFGAGASYAQTIVTSETQKPVSLFGTNTAGNGQSEKLQSEKPHSGTRKTDLTIDDALNIVTAEMAETADGGDKQDAVSGAASGVTALANPQTNLQTSSQNNAVTTSVTVGLRTVDNVGLAAVGIRGSADGSGNLDELIWRGTAASRAAFLFARAQLTTQSPALAAMALEVTAKEAVPPVGANLIARNFVQARLNLLAAAGRSNDLSVLVQRLPNDDDWLDWKKWLVEYQLMQRHDQDACATVAAFTARTLDPYWHKLKVICSTVQADASSARFGADILAASGVDDPVFFALVDEMLNGVKAQAFDPALVEPLHVVLMDVAHHEIGLNSLAALPAQMAQGTVALRYLGDDARMVSTFDSLAKGLITAEEAGKLWRSATTPPERAPNAVARHNSGATPLTTAMSWRAIAADRTAARMVLIPQALKTDIANGNGLMMLPLYAALAREAVNFPDLDSVISADDGQSLSHIAFLVAAHNPQDEVLQNEALAVPIARDVAALLRMLDDAVWNERAIANLDMWPLLPVIEAVGVVPDNPEWLDMLTGDAVAPKNHAVLPPLLMRALAAAAEKRHVAETVLLASWAVGDTPLHLVNPRDAATIISAMNAIGQTGTGKQFAAEVVTAHLLQRFHQTAPSMTVLASQEVATPEIETPKTMASDDGITGQAAANADNGEQTSTPTSTPTSSVGQE